MVSARLQPEVIGPALPASSSRDAFSGTLGALVRYAWLRIGHSWSILVAMVKRAALCLLIAISASSTRPSSIRDVPRASSNDNRHAAGTLRNGVLTLQLDAGVANWQPDGSSGPHLHVQAFAERGHAIQIPGPLIRVSTGTELRISVRNRLDRPLIVRGLYDRGRQPDSLALSAGETREIRFRATTPGTFFYWGRTANVATAVGRTEDSQLLGAFVVDSQPGAVRDRILVLTAWVHPADTALLAGERREVLAINGLSWPYTERFRFQVGDTVQWRVINGNNRLHPMHLHGFYFHVTSRGTSARDTLYGPAQQRAAVTELMAAATTMSMTWVPTRPGNWLFHCHLIAHIAPQIRNHYKDLGGGDRPHAASHAFDGMAGLVSGITVTPRPGTVVAGPAAPARSLRLFVHKRAHSLGDATGYGFILQEGPDPPAPDSIRIPGSPIVLQRDEPVSITLLNRTDELVSVHWHGIEVESYFDGVADWSGDSGHTAPRIAPGDSFIVRLTPDRAGTFIYHTHQDEGVQLSSGLYGPFVVLAPGEVRDTITDRVFLIGRAGPGPDAPALLNGSRDPGALEWKVGVTYRLRFINITPNDVEEVSFRRDSSLLQWRPFAKDGAEIAAQQATSRPARLRMGPGETYDFEFTPREPADLTLHALVRARADKIVGDIRLPIHVR